MGSWKWFSGSGIIGRNLLSDTRAQCRSSFLYTWGEATRLGSRLCRFTGNLAALLIIHIPCRWSSCISIKIAKMLARASLVRACHSRTVADGGGKELSHWIGWGGGVEGSVKMEENGMG